MFKFSSLLLMAALMLPFHSAQAADWPERSIKLIVPFAPGGETDLVARVVGESISKDLGKTVVVQNITGALGLTGISEILKSGTDGYTFGVIPSAPLTVFPHTRQLPYSLDSFDFIGRLMTSSYFLVTSSDSPWNTPQDVVDACKKEPDKYYYSTSGQNTIPHIATAGFLLATGSKIKPVNLASNADTAHAFASGRVQLFSSTYDFVAQNNIKALCVFEPERLAKLPDIPTIKEFGVEHYIGQFLVLVAPKGVPADIEAKMSAAVEKALQDPNVLEMFDKFGINSAYLNPDESLAFVKETSAANAKIVSELKKQQ